jgi:hypothetical protein
MRQTFKFKRQNMAKANANKYAAWRIIRPKKFFPAIRHHRLKAALGKRLIKK